MNVCAFPDCSRPARSRGLCGAHYQQQRNGRQLTPILPLARPERTVACPKCGALPGEGCWVLHADGRSRHELATYHRARSRALDGEA